MSCGYLSAQVLKCLIAVQFGFFWTLAATTTCLQELAGGFRPRLLPDAQNMAFAKNRSCSQILDMSCKEYK